MLPLRCGLARDREGWERTENPICRKAGHVPCRFFRHVAITTQPKAPTQPQIIERAPSMAMRVRTETRHTIRIRGDRLKRDRSITHVDARLSPQLNSNACARMSVPVLYRTVKYADSAYYFLF